MFRRSLHQVGNRGSTEIARDSSLMAKQHIQQHTAQHWHSAEGSAACWAPHSAMRRGIGIGLPQRKPAGAPTCRQSCCAGGRSQRARRCSRRPPTAAASAAAAAGSGRRAARCRSALSPASPSAGGKWMKQEGRLGVGAGAGRRGAVRQRVGHPSAAPRVGHEERMQGLATLQQPAINPQAPCSSLDSRQTTSCSQPSWAVISFQPSTQPQPGQATTRRPRLTANVSISSSSFFCRSLSSALSSACLAEPSVSSASTSSICGQGEQLSSGQRQ